MTEPTGGRNGRRFPKDIWTVGVILMVLLLLSVAIGFDIPALRRLADPQYARGVITFVITLSAIGISFIMVYQAFFAVERTDDAFKHAREIFTGLMGVLGTIVGFYFGSTQTGSSQIEVAQIRRSDGVITTFISGGTPPYNFTVSANDSVVSTKTTDDGLIVDTLAVDSSAIVSVRVTDSQGRKGEAKLEGKRSSAPRPDTGKAK